MKSYRVVWEIDIDAESFLEAAVEARNIQRDYESTATLFTVTDDQGKVWDIDLLEMGEKGK